MSSYRKKTNPRIWKISKKLPKYLGLSNRVAYIKMCPVNIGRKELGQRVLEDDGSGRTGTISCFRVHVCDVWVYINPH